MSVLQPRLTDEEGWKRFCLGEKIGLGTSSSHTDAQPEPALDYSKVIEMSIYQQQMNKYLLVSNVTSQSFQLSIETGGVC